MASGAEVRQGAERYRFDGIVVDAAAHTLVRDGGIQQVEPKAFAVLLELLRHPGELIDRDRLLDAVWGHRHVTPGVLTRAIAQLRIALNDNALHPRYIQTQHALGYRFVGTLQVEPEAAPPEPPAEAVAEAEHGPYRPMPYAGTERRFESRYRRWGWLAAGALLLASALAWGIRERRAAPAPASSPSIAVLPFTTLSDDRRDDYFAEGLATEMHSALAGVRGIKVAAWLPPEAIDRKLDMQALGRKLDVATVLDATVRRDGQRFRISARLSDTGNGVTLWSHTYERDAEAIFDTQSEIANEVATTLVGVLPDAGAGLRKRLAPTRNFAAFDAYLKGLQLLLRPASADGNAEGAMGYFRQALDEDKDFARAQAGICRAEVKRFEYTNDTSAYDLAVAACDLAKKMDPGSGESSLALAELHQTRGDLDKAVEYYAKAEANPEQRSAVYVGLAGVEAARGNQDAALANFERALEIRPGDASIYANIGYYHYIGGNLPLAIDAYRKALDLRPNDSELWSALGGIYINAGNNVAAAAALERSLAIKPGYVALTNLGELKFQAGQYAEAARLNRKAAELEPADFRPWGNLGDALLADSATESAREAYRKAIELGKRYIAVHAADAQAIALVGWFAVNVGDSDTARRMIRESETLNADTGEIALINAQTSVALEDLDGARARISIVRESGIPENRIRSNVFLRRAESGRSGG